ncbi:hypothetical protein R6Q57_007175 [Mikania cordata]
MTITIMLEAKAKATLRPSSLTVITMTITIMLEAKAKATLRPSSLTVITYMEQTRAA